MASSSPYRIFLLATLTLTSCPHGYAFLGPHRAAPDHKHKPADRDALARAMTDNDAYVVFDPKTDHLWLRRCVVGEAEATCEVSHAREGYVATAATATHRRNQTNDAPRAEMASAIAEALPDRKPAFLVRRGKGNSGEVSVRDGSPAVRYALRDGILQLHYIASAEATSTVRVAEVHYGANVEVASSYMSFSHLGLFALRMNHTTEHGVATSWFVFRLSPTDARGHGWVVQSLQGHVGRIVTQVPRRDSRPLRSPAKAHVPPPAATPTSPVTLPPAPLRACKSATDCSAPEVCETPEAYSHNACGRPRPPDCDEGWQGDRCGHCYQQCTADADCEGDKRCDGHICASPARCLPPRPRWQ